jgi:uncharacterized protein (DUF433 family)
MDPSIVALCRVEHPQSLIDKQIIYDNDQQELFVVGTSLQVEYVLNLLAFGLAPEKIVYEHKGLALEDIAACLAIAKAQYNVPRGRNSIKVDHCVARHRMDNPWIKLHPFYSDTPSVEYRLPVPFIAPEVREFVAPWLQKFIGTFPAQSRDVLASRMNQIHHDALQGLRELILEYAGAALLLHKTRSWLVLEDGNRSDMNLFLIPPEQERSHVDFHLQSWPFAKREILREFYYNLAGLKEMVPNETGCEFCLPSSTLRNALGGDILDLSVSKDWLDAMPIYRSACGDYLVIHPTGILTWYLHETRTVTDIYEDFEVFLSSYVTFRRTKRRWLEPFFGVAVRGEGDPFPGNSSSPRMEGN